MRIGGIILCGGESSRMGQPKAWLPFGDELLLPRVVRILAEVVSPIVVVAAAGQELPPLPAEVRIARDEVAGRGPLQGMAAGLAAMLDAEAVFVTACDVPLLKPEFIRLMLEQLGDHDAAVPCVDGQIQPLSAVYRVNVTCTETHRLLAANRAAVRELVPALRSRIVEEDVLRTVDPELDSLRNANTPEEYQRLLAAK